MELNPKGAFLVPFHMSEINISKRAISLSHFGNFPSNSGLPSPSFSPLTFLRFGKFIELCRLGRSSGRRKMTWKIHIPWCLVTKCSRCKQNIYLKKNIKCVLRFVCNILGLSWVIIIIRTTGSSSMTWQLMPALLRPIISSWLPGKALTFRSCGFKPPFSRYFCAFFAFLNKPENRIKNRSSDIKKLFLKLFCPLDCPSTPPSFVPICAKSSRNASKPWLLFHQCSIRSKCDLWARRFSRGRWAECDRTKYRKYFHQRMKWNIGKLF